MSKREKLYKEGPQELKRTRRSSKVPPSRSAVPPRRRPEPLAVGPRVFSRPPPRGPASSAPPSAAPPSAVPPSAAASSVPPSAAPPQVLPPLKKRKYAFMFNYNVDGVEVGFKSLNSDHEIFKSPVIREAIEQIKGEGNVITELMDKRKISKEDFERYISFIDRSNRVIRDFQELNRMMVVRGNLQYPEFYDMIKKVFKVLLQSRRYDIINNIHNTREVYNRLYNEVLHPEVKHYLKRLLQTAFIKAKHGLPNYSYEKVPNIHRVRRYIASEEMEQWTPIGKGTFGFVGSSRRIGWKPKFSGQQKEDDKRTVAIKQVKRVHRDNDFSTPDQILLNEVNILTKLCGHPHVAKLMDNGVALSAKYFYMMLQYRPFDFRTLLSSREYPYNIKGLNPGVIKNYIYQILLGLDWVHHNNIIHADLKPENILVNTETRHNTLEITDFGTSIETDPQRNQCGIVKWTTPIVTYIYRAPELFLKKRFTNKIDIWSVGVILLEMVLGYNPFTPNRYWIKDYAMKTGKDGSNLDQRDYDKLAWVIIQTLGTRENLEKLLNGTYKQEFKDNKKEVYKTYDYPSPRNYKNDEDLLDLLKKLLYIDQNYRITTKTALHHPYFYDVVYQPLPFVDYDCFNRVERNQ